MKHKAVRLPKEFKKYFWDVDFKKLSLKKHLNFILSRLMNLGDQKVLKWLLRLPPKVIIGVVKKSRELDDKTRNYWLFIYGKRPVS